jgi:hypothetical protein
MFGACRNCGYSAHVGHLQGNFCPRCGKEITVVRDTREIPDLDERDRKWKQLQELQKQFK